MLVNFLLNISFFYCDDVKIYSHSNNIFELVSIEPVRCSYSNASEPNSDKQSGKSEFFKKIKLVDK